MLNFDSLNETGIYPRKTLASTALIPHTPRSEIRAWTVAIKRNNENKPMKPGDKVVHVGIKGGSRLDPSVHVLIGSRVKKGRIYVIAKVIHHADLPNTGLALIGSSVLWRHTGIEIGWHSAAFRKLDELKDEARLRQSQPQPA